jgi:hypothetical protein
MLHSGCKNENPKYERRDPSQTPCYQIIQEELETFLADREHEGRPVPDFVEKEFRAYLECGILAHGFVRMHCDSCSRERIVAFSCKKRGFCPSCWAKRMAESAEHLVENVLPVAPYRQFVVSFPVPLRYWMHTNQLLFGKIHKIVTREISRAYEKEALQRGCKNPKNGSVSFLQRFGSALNLNPHLHIIVLDGVFDGRTLVNLSESWTDEKLEKLTSRIVSKAIKLLMKSGYIGNDQEVIEAPQIDPLFEEEEAYSAASQASMSGRIAFGENKGLKMTRVHSGFGFYEESPVPKGPLCVQLNGFSIHCRTAVRALEREKLERLLRYMARGPISNERLSLHPGKRVRVEFKRPWSDGTTGISMTYSEFLEKLMALIPPPRRSLTRWNGIFAPASTLRREIAPRPSVKKGFDFQNNGINTDKPTRSRGRSWARLLKRIFKIDVLECSCGGRLRPVAALSDFSSCKRYLENMGYDSDPPILHPARSQEIPFIY